MKFIAINRFKIFRKREQDFEHISKNRETHLDGVPGFMEFHLIMHLYSIQVFLSSGELNLCPADYCKPSDEPQSINNTPLDDPNTTNRAPVAIFNPPAQIIENDRKIMAASNIEVGGVEYLINESDGLEYYYDINALSNFVANPNEIVGFDPFPSLVDFVVSRANEPLAVTL